MVAVVILSRKFHINPDNVATPVGGALGDLTTLSLLSGIAMLLFAVLETHVWLPPLLLCFCMGLAPIWWLFAHSNDYTHNVLYSGWLPVIAAMVISSIGGLILDYAVSRYEGIAVFQPVVNGVGGNLVAVQASRLATALHQASVPGILPVNAVHGIPNPVSTFFGKSSSARTARVLMLLVIPSHTVFMFTIQYMRSGHVAITPRFGVLFLLATVIQVAALLYIANGLVPWLWKRGHDPDNFSIPFLTAVGDLLGGALLALTFHFLYLLGDSAASEISATDSPFLSAFAENISIAY